MKRVKRGYFFSMDVLIASIVVFSVLLTVFVFYLQKQATVQTIYYAEDIANMLSELKINDVSGEDYVKYLIDNGYIENSNRSVLEEIGRLWVLRYNEESTSLAASFLNNTLPSNFGYSILMNESIIYTHEKNYSNLISVKKMVSGIETGKAIEGLSSRIFLKGFNSKITSSYFYFGGYIGEGNITMRIVLPEDIVNISSAMLELDAGNDFDLYINTNFSGHFTAEAPNMSADIWYINNSYLGYFHNGTNFININFTDKVDNYIAGGFLKIVYETSTFGIINYSANKSSQKYWFPGINGFVNIYSSFYVPGSLDSMDIFLSFLSNYSIFLTVGDVIVFSYVLGNTSNYTQQNISLSDSYLSSLLDYSSLSKSTVPIRLAIDENITSIIGGADVALVTDASGSMLWCTDGDEGSSFSCTDWYNGSLHLRGYRWTKTTQCERRIDVARNASLQFANILFENPRNKMSLVDYTNWYGGCTVFGSWRYCYVCGYPANCGWNFGSVNCVVPFPDGIAKLNTLTGNYTKVINLINGTDTWWGTCTCCGVNRARGTLVASNSSNNKVIVLMSDGEANERCAEQGTGSAKQDAIQAALDACALNISVYTIGFGSDADEDTLEAMACGNGSYHNATNISLLVDVYKEIAEEILRITYSTQAVNLSGPVTRSVLYPNSFIQLNYTTVIEPLKYGVIPVEAETGRFGNTLTDGSFFIPNDAEIIDATLTSYSGDKWTSLTGIQNTSSGNWIYFYNLSSFGDYYLLLGDPFIVNIPVEYIQHGNNPVRIRTGLSSLNISGGSADDKAIYILGLKTYVNYTGVFENAEGCEWTLVYEDNSSSVLKVPASYNGDKTCSYSQDTHCDTDYNNDAIDNAFCHLLDKLDFDDNGKLSVKLGEENLQLDTLSIGGVPFMWGPSLIEIRVMQ